MKMKKAMAMVLAGAMVMSMGAGFAASAEEVTEVTFWTLNTRQNAVDPIVEAFNSENTDVHVTPTA